MYMKSKFPNVALSYIISYDLDSYLLGPDMRKGSINKLVLVYQNIVTLCNIEIIILKSSKVVNPSVPPTLSVLIQDSDTRQTAELSVFRLLMNLNHSLFLSVEEIESTINTGSLSCFKVSWASVVQLLIYTRTDNIPS